MKSLYNDTRDRVTGVGIVLISLRLYAGTSPHWCSVNGYQWLLGCLNHLPQSPLVLTHAHPMFVKFTVRKFSIAPLNSQVFLRVMYKTNAYSDTSQTHKCINRWVISALQFKVNYSAFGVIITNTIDLEIQSFHTEEYEEMQKFSAVQKYLSGHVNLPNVFPLKDHYSLAK